MNKYQLLIDGKSKDAVSGKEFPVVNPANNEVFAMVSEGDREDIDIAVKAARRAFDDGPWSKLSTSDRGKLLGKVADIIRKRTEELASLDTMDCGKPIADTLGVDVPVAAEFFDYFAGMPDKITGQTIPLSPDFLNYTLREPLGVVGQITAWNFPILNATIKIAPALACGNTIVLKAAEQTPLSAIELGKICLEAGIPDGVVNIVPGFGPTAGEALVTHPDVDKIAFTGSTEVGRHIMRMAAGTLKPVTLELGGKSPNIVLADADIDAAVYGALHGIFLNQGQVCGASSRLFLHEEIYDEFLERLLSAAQELRVGNPLDKNTQMGALVSAEQLERVKSYIAVGKEEGAELLIGGESPQDESLRKGCFFCPTVFGNVENGMRIAQEEIFGPVLSVMKFRDDGEAMRMANDVAYGLAAAVWTKDMRKAHLFARGLKAGTVWINITSVFSWAAPYGGYKQSGFGREMGWEAVNIYTHTKNVWVNLGTEPNRWADGQEN